MCQREKIGRQDEGLTLVCCVEFVLEIHVRMLTCFLKDVSRMLAVGLCGYP